MISSEEGMLSWLQMLTVYRAVIVAEGPEMAQGHWGHMERCLRQRDTRGSTTTINDVHSGLSSFPSLSVYLTVKQG